MIASRENIGTPTARAPNTACPPRRSAGSSQAPTHRRRGQACAPNPQTRIAFDAELPTPALRAGRLHGHRGHLRYDEPGHSHASHAVRHQRETVSAISVKRVSAIAEIRSLSYAKPHVERFFAWAEERFAAQGLLPSNKLTQALADALQRRAGLMVFLQDEQVSLDTNHVERAIRPIALGRNNANCGLMRTRRRPPGARRSESRLAAVPTRSGLRIRAGISCGGNPTSGDLRGCVPVHSSGTGGMAAR